MAYTIQCIVAQRGTFPAKLPPGLVLVQLNLDIEMIPLGDSARESYGIPSLPLTGDGDTAFPSALRELCTQLRVQGDLAYIEAEIFGGYGAQAHVMVRSNGEISSPQVADHAISAALQLLGVRPGSEDKDEFAAVGLGRFRETDAWIDDFEG